MKYKKYMERDIVQFVPFNSFSTQEQLTKATLEEIPTQFVEYMTKRGIIPNLDPVTDELKQIPETHKTDFFRLKVQQFKDHCGRSGADPNVVRVL